ncbi:hypothetical protein NA56DRAFT_708929 [Hyaloscypha hepaticicola]|uniref:Uncharacterized protein n=1 Tax=Hyaloscypha hepaticicola TaxID=2082293 RepID=A0A2J6PQR7_9HELO|nr:hypothetical protein NA56DRAFT_708929 [Hyaloscypha hepaticicola]
MEIGLDASYQRVRRVAMGLCGVEVLWLVMVCACAGLTTYAGDCVCGDLLEKKFEGDLINGEKRR